MLYEINEKVMEETHENYRITACPTGIAHTYMAQECLEKECEKRLDVKIETGRFGIENEVKRM